MTSTIRPGAEPGNAYTSVRSTRGLSSTIGVSWWSEPASSLTPPASAPVRTRIAASRWVRGSARQGCMTGLLEMSVTKPGTDGDGGRLHRLRPIYARHRGPDLWSSKSGKNWGLRTEKGEYLVP